MAFIRRACSTYNHPVGTCAMGSGREAVVDAELRVRGVDGLRIADASVMPTITSANTNAPSIMIGEFAARRIGSGSSAESTGPPGRGVDRHRGIRGSAPRFRGLGAAR